MAVRSLRALRSLKSLEALRTLKPQADSYSLYTGLLPQNNRWTFLKLNTRTGAIVHIQYSTDGKAMQYPLNSIPLVDGEDAKLGRFFLYPTENTFNFILLDQNDGRVWQVQWNIDEENQGVWRIY